MLAAVSSVAGRLISTWVASMVDLFLYECQSVENAYQSLPEEETSPGLGIKINVLGRLCSGMIQSMQVLNMAKAGNPYPLIVMCNQGPRLLAFMKVVPCAHHSRGGYQPAVQGLSLGRSGLKSFSLDQVYESQYLANWPGRFIRQDSD